MRARAFLLLCASGFGAGTVLFALTQHVQGRPIETSLAWPLLFALAFVVISVRLPEPTAAGPSCRECGHLIRELAFCSRCGSAG